MDHAWDEGFKKLSEYKEEFGNTDCVKTFLTTEGYNLGLWAQTQRQRKRQGKLDRTRILKLESIGFTWNPKDLEWPRGLPYMEKYFEKHGHSNVPATYKTEDGFSLGTWLSRNRKLIRDGKLSPERFELLAPFQIQTDPSEAKWMVAYSHLQKFYIVNGHSRVPSSYKTECGFALGTWVQARRSDIRGRHAKSLSKKRIELLNKIDFVWDPMESDWLNGLQSLQKFYDANGVIRIPGEYIDDNGFKLGHWVNNVLRSKKAGNLPIEKELELKSLGFQKIDFQNELFEKGLQQVQEAFNELKSKTIPHNHVTKDGFHIGQ